MNYQQSMQWQGKMLGRYEMVRLLGRGGMGEVWLAQDTALRRQVAIKLLPSVLRTNDAYLRAFAHEARVAAALEHPYILPVHDFGEQQIGQDEIITYLVIPYITGGSLRDRIRNVQGPLLVQEALHYLRQAAEAIDFAHSRNVLHRDIKPANMLLQDDWLFLSDFGLAKLLSATTRSGTHAGAGTPEYMAPEQAMGNATPASDRYSLAMVAYQLFTGQLPFRGETPYELLVKQTKEVPPSPRQFNPAIPPAVEHVLLKGLAKHPEDRPITAKVFVDELTSRWRVASLQQRDPDATVLAPWSKRYADTSNRHTPSNTPATPATPAPSSPSTPTPVAGTPGAPGMYGISSASNPSYGTNSPGVFTPIMSSTPAPTPTPVQATPVPTPAPYSPYSHPPMGHMPSPVFPQPQTQGVTLQQQSMMRTVPETPRPPLAEPQQNEQPAPKIRRRTLLIGGAVTAAVVAAGGITATSLLLHNQLAKAPVTATLPGPHHFVPGTPVLSLTGHSDEVWMATWSSDGRYLATGGQDTRVMLWDVGNALKTSKTAQTIPTPLRQWKFDTKFYGNSIAWVNNDRSLALTPTANNAFYVVDATNSAKPPITYTDAKESAPVNGLVPYNAYMTVAWSQKANQLVICQYPDFNATSSVFAEIWSLQNTQQPVRILTQKVDSAPSRILVDEMQWSPDGTLLAGLLNNYTLVFWSAKTGTITKVLQLPARTTTQNPYTLRDDLIWSPVDPSQLIAINIDVVNLFDIRQGKVLLSLGTDDPDALTPPKNNTTSFKWLPNVTGITWSPNGRYVAGSYGRSNKIYVWDLQEKNPKLAKDGTRLQTYLFGAQGGHADTIINLTWSPDGRYIASTSFDKTVIVWKVDAS